jgi:hypothetical protein
MNCDRQLRSRDVTRCAVPVWSPQARSLAAAQCLNALSRVDLAAFQRELSAPAGSSNINPASNQRMRNDTRAAEGRISSIPTTGFGGGGSHTGKNRCS